MTENSDFRCGFVALCGRPNVGKSTLVNALLGEKVAIVSPKPQTTRNRIHGILNRPNGQLVLVDTPGMCAPGRPLANVLRRIAGQAVSEADVALIVVEVRGETAQIHPQDEEVLRAAKSGTGKMVVAINKIDRVRRKDDLLPWIARFAGDYSIETVVPVSALRHDGLDRLEDALWGMLPKGAALFPNDLHTDQAERFLCAELVREQLLIQLQQEVPHSAAVLIDSFEDLRDTDRPLCRIEGRIIVERPSQQGIVVGKKGEQIKSISQAARGPMEQLLGAQVYLRLAVQVEKDWTRNENAMRRMGVGSAAESDMGSTFASDLEAELVTGPESGSESDSNDP